ncbi:MAG: hypothetical protein WCT39_01200 [Candidatus Margulisiibacteriota bacterium]
MKITFRFILGLIGETIRPYPLKKALTPTTLSPRLRAEEAVKEAPRGRSLAAVILRDCIRDYSYLEPEAIAVYKDYVATFTPETRDHQKAILAEEILTWARISTMPYNKFIIQRLLQEFNLPQVAP